MIDIDPQQEGKLKQFHRLLISYNDFKRPAWIASYILDHKFQEQVDRRRGIRRYRIKLLWEALNCAMIVSYCRPFCGSDKRLSQRIPDLPKRFLRMLTKEECEVHDVAIEDRNTLLAHSDSEAWNLRTFFLETAPDRKILVPLHSDTRAPLIHEVVERLARNCCKLMELIMVERERLEKELAHLLPTVPASDLVDAAPDEGHDAG